MIFLLRNPFLDFHFLYFLCLNIFISFFFSISEKGESNNPRLVVLDINCTSTNDSGSQVDTTETAKKSCAHCKNVRFNERGIC